MLFFFGPSLLWQSLLIGPPAGLRRLGGVELEPLADALAEDVEGGVALHDLLRAGTGGRWRGTPGTSPG